MKVGEAFRLIIGAAVKIYATYRLDWALGFLTQEFLGPKNFASFAVHNLARVFLLPALSKTKQLDPADPPAGPRPQAAVVGIPPLPRRK